MVRNKYLVYLLCVFVVLFSGCRKHVIDDGAVKDEKASLSLNSDDRIVFDDSGGQSEIVFVATSECQVKVSERASNWCNVGDVVDKGDGVKSLKVWVDNNDDYQERNASVTISLKGYNLKETVTIVQKQKDAILVSSNKIEAGAEEGIYTLSIRHNVDYKYIIEGEAVNWIEFVETKGSGLETSEMHIHVKANESPDKRQGNIFFSTEEGLNETVVVYQEGEKESIVLTTDRNLTIGSDGGIVKVELRSNVEVSVEYPDFDWVKLVESKSHSTYTYYFQIDRNETHDERNVAISFVGDKTKEIVTIVQKQKDAILISSNKIEVEAVGGNVDIEVRANVDYDCCVDPSNDWVKIASQGATKSLIDSRIRLYIEPNEELDGRQAKVTVSSGDIKETVSIYQYGAEPTLILSQDKFIVSSNEEIIRIEVRTNSDYKYEIKQEVSADSLWVQPYETRSMSSYTHQFIVMPNYYYDSRCAQIIFTNLVNNTEYPVEIVQNQRDAIILSQDEYYFDCRECKLSFDILTNIDFDVEISSEWITQEEIIQTKGLVEKTLDFCISENTFREPREAIIRLTGQDVEQDIKIHQKGFTDNIRLDISHNNAYMQVPLFTGETVYGDVSWGDGSTEDYRKRLSHSYVNNEAKTVEFDIYGSDSFVIEQITGVSSFVLYRDSQSAGSVEDIIIDKIEWD